MQYGLKMFGHLIADKASMCLVDDPENLPALFEKFQIEFADDPERLAVIADIEAMAQALAGKPGTKSRAARRHGPKLTLAADSRKRRKAAAT